MNGPSTPDPGESALGSIDARVKIVSLLLFISVVAISVELNVLLLSLLFVLALLLFSRVPPKLLVTRFLFSMPFIGFASLSLYLVGSPLSALAMLIRISTCVLAVILLSGTTSLLDLIEGLRRLGVPRILLILVLFTYRYIHLFNDEMRRILTARKARGGRKGRHLLDGRFMKSLSTMIGMIIVRAFWRGDRIFDALLVRQYKGDIRVRPQKALSSVDVGFGVFVASVSLILILGNLGVIWWI
ncbi:MAG: energy-coupling factor transporter transmembrane component T family protein [Thermoplasmata archaeon]